MELFQVKQTNSKACWNDKRPNSNCMFAWAFLADAELSVTIVQFQNVDSLTRLGFR